MKWIRKNVHYSWNSKVKIKINFWNCPNERILTNWSVIDILPSNSMNGFCIHIFQKRIIPNKKTSIVNLLHEMRSFEIKRKIYIKHTRYLFDYLNSKKATNEILTITQLLYSNLYDTFILLNLSQHYVERNHWLLLHVVWILLNIFHLYQIQNKICNNNYNESMIHWKQYSKHILYASNWKPRKERKKSTSSICNWTV